MPKARLDTRYLEQRHLTWHYVRDFPRGLHEAIGKRRLVVSLQTHDLRVALAHRYEVSATFERMVTAARRKAGPDAAVEVGLAFRERLARIEAGDAAVIAATPTPQEPMTTYDGSRPLTNQEMAEMQADLELDLMAEHFEETEGAAAATTLLDVARGRATPLLHFVDAWLAEGGAKGPLKERTKASYKADVERLGAWAKRVRVPSTIEAFTRKVAGRYVTEELVTAKVDAKTANRRISAVSSYWRWLCKRAGVDANPWERQSVAKATRPGDRSKRPYTDKELRALLDGPADAEIADMIRVAALSGMRVEEIYRLTVETSANGWFAVSGAKTRAGDRRVPIHSGLKDIVARRRADKEPGEFLFHEAGKPKGGRERSMAVSKRFGRYRQTCGVHEKAEGRRSSAVDLHSARRWFITTARNAGQDRAMVAAVVGHEAGNITDDTYSGGPSDEVRRAVVEAVKLPALSDVALSGSIESGRPDPKSFEKPPG
jgi:integrase